MTQDASTPVTALFLFDNSRLKLETSCPRARYLEYHSGPTGYGIRLKRQAMPLVTGIALHFGEARILSWTLKHGGGTQLPPREFVREVITDVAFKYYKRCEARGYIGVEDVFADRTLREQTALIEGLLWGSYRTLLPALLREYRVIAVETEGEVIVVGCTCGLGDTIPPYQAHDARGCQGSGAMSKSDVLLQRLTDGTLVNADFKSSGDVDEWSWAERQNTGMQFALQCLGWRLRGYEVHETLVLGLNKGWRKRAQEEDEFGRKRVTQESAKDQRQDSIFCWAWRRPGSGLGDDEVWQASWRYKELNTKGELVGRTLQGKGYDKAPIWEARFAGKPADWTTSEYWVEWLDVDLLGKEFSKAGPFTTPAHKIESIITSLGRNGADWQAKLWRIYEVMQEAGWDTTDPRVQRVLDVEVPQSWQCIQYRKDCQFREVCERKLQGWADPLGTGLFELRSPHHALERVQAEGRGIELPPDQEEDDDEE